MNPIDKLTEYFKQFPGIGERQAKRFVYFLLTKDEEFLNNLADSITKVGDGVRSCTKCQRFFSGKDTVCELCTNVSDIHSLLIVEKDADLEAFLKSREYSGYYFVLGGLISVIEKNGKDNIRINDCLKRITELKKDGLSEIILGFSLTPSGEHTDEYVRQVINQITDDTIKIVSLGRGLSTGTELEYADKQTIGSALKSRG